MKTITIEYDGLTTSIKWTDNVTPLEALGLLRYHEKNVYAGLLNYNLSLEKEKTEPKKDIYIRDLRWPTRLYKCLRENNINTLSDLEKICMRDLLRFRNLGKKSIEQLEILLKEHNIIIN